MRALRLSTLREFQELDLRICAHMILTLIRADIASVARGAPALMRAGYTAAEISRHARTIDVYFDEHRERPPAPAPAEPYILSMVGG